MFKNILVPIDFSEQSKAAIGIAVDLAQAVDGRVTVMHVHTLQHMAAPVISPGSGVPQVTPALDNVLKEQEEKRLSDLVSDKVPPAVWRKQVFRTGDPAREIGAQIVEGGHDLVVMGTHGRTGLKAVFMGSVAQRVVRDGTVPVLVTH